MDEMVEMMVDWVDDGRVKVATRVKTARYLSKKMAGLPFLARLEEVMW